MACGSGRDLLLMKKRGFDVIGFDRSPALAELARGNAACEVIEGDFETYDFSSMRVDAGENCALCVQASLRDRPDPVKIVFPGVLERSGR